MQYWLCPTQQNYKTVVNLCPGGTNVLCCMPDMDKIRALTQNGASSPIAQPTPPYSVANPTQPYGANPTQPYSVDPNSLNGPPGDLDSSDFTPDSFTPNNAQQSWGNTPYSDAPGDDAHSAGFAANSAAAASYPHNCFGSDTSHPRQKLVQAAMALYNNRASGHYSQDDQRWSGISGNVCPPNSPPASDCSSAVTWMYWTVFGNGPDIVNGASANWRWGSTQTLIQNGHEVTMAQAQPGDLVFYGSSHDAISHVTIYVGNGNVVSHGKDPASFYHIGPYKMIRSYI